MTIDDRVRMMLRSLFLERGSAKQKDRVISRALAIRAKALHGRREAALEHLGDRWLGRPEGGTDKSVWPMNPSEEIDELRKRARRKKAAEAVRGRFGG